MTKYAGSNCLGKTLCRFFRDLVVSVLLVSWWSLNCVSVALWWCVGSVLSVFTVFSDVLGVLLMFGGVPVVSRRCSGGVLGVLREWYVLD